MGCAASRIDKEERVQVCKERKKLMKHLVGFRGEFADAQLAYLRALKNTGVTLRQFTESESLELENTPFGLVLPPSPPPPLPPSPPPPPPFSPDLRKFNNNQKDEIAQEESIEIGEDDSCTPPPPPISSSHWEFWDPFSTSLPPREKNNATAEEPVEEENWAETNTEFEEEDQEEEAVVNNGLHLLPEKPHTIELVDDNSSMVSWHTKDTADMAMVVWRSKKTLTGIVKELDDYFLKASAGGNDIAVLMDINRGDTFLQQDFKENKKSKCYTVNECSFYLSNVSLFKHCVVCLFDLYALSGKPFPVVADPCCLYSPWKRCNSAKVFSALSWSWSSKSLQFARDAAESSGPNEPCMPGVHCITLDKLYAEERRLYKEVKVTRVFDS
ncbi:hypothetical protein CK203_085946 [Vitis vinifera]|uniref:DUF630 domain-containing protein n=1 Tax=Vitis vinifera TaxID=29760 RepID=A0A438DVT8_VITVI|nr:hypothetical protein CK203_085946 [Vitis vinifera]